MGGLLLGGWEMMPRVRFRDDGADADYRYGNGHFSDCVFGGICFSVAFWLVSGVGVAHFS